MTGKEIKLWSFSNYPSQNAISTNPAAKYDLSESACIRQIKQDTTESGYGFTTLLVGCNAVPYLRLFKLYPIYRPENETTNNGNGFTSLYEWREETDRMDVDVTIDGPVTSFSTIFSPQIGTVPDIQEDGKNGIGNSFYSSNIIVNFTHPDVAVHGTKRVVLDPSIADRIPADHVVQEVGDKLRIGRIETKK